MNTNAPLTAYMFEAILASLAMTLVAGWLGMRIARKLGWMDIPGSQPHKQHRFPTPLAGGITLMLALLVLILASGLWRFSITQRLALPTLVIFGFALWDDIKPLPAWAKFGGQLLGAALLILMGVQIRILQNPRFFGDSTGIGFRVLDWGLTLLWVVGVTNAFNLIDSMDGLTAGLSGWAFAFFMLATFDSQQRELSIFSALMLGICLGLYYYNAPAARLFLGDSGAQTLGFLLSTVAILYTPLEKNQASSWFIPILLVAVPIFDTTLVTLSRLRRRLPFYKGNRDHTYHRLVSWGMHPNRAVLTLHIAALILECVAFIAVSLPPLAANLVFLACLLTGLILIVLLDRRSRWPAESTDE